FGMVGIENWRMVVFCYRHCDPVGRLVFPHCEMIRPRLKPTPKTQSLRGFFDLEWWELKIGGWSFSATAIAIP
ncbi:MAG: hypothetical protein AAGA66_03920, partial [Bacteroidota bacterium]